MDGVVQMDGAHVSGRIRKPRVKKTSTKTQARDKYPYAAFPKHANKRVVMTVRELFTATRQGASRTAVAIAHAEDEATIGVLSKKFIKPGAIVMTDELPGYIRLRAKYDHRTVNHSKEFSTDDGTNSNQAESYFARVRRFIIGQTHRVTPKYMLQYMTEMAWREDKRRRRTSIQVSHLLGLMFT